MTHELIRIAPRLLGHNAVLAHGFMMGTLPGGGYGIRWRCDVGGEPVVGYQPPWAPGGLGSTQYWFAWGPPHDAVRVEFEGREYVFCLETATDEDVLVARRVEYQRLQEGR